MVTVRTEPLEGAELEFENRPPLAQTPPPPCESLLTKRRGSWGCQRCTYMCAGKIFQMVCVGKTFVVVFLFSGDR